MRWQKIRAIATHFGIQVSAAYAHVQKIKAKGFLS